MAPGARLLVQGGIFREDNWLAADLFEKAYRTNGASCRIHNNSWGPRRLKKDNPFQKAYKSGDAEGVDEWALKNPDFLIIYSAGNDGTWKTESGGQVGAWVVAKNVLTVGASYTDRPINSSEVVDYSVQPFTFKRGVTSYSSRGPVLNTQRTKPDVVTPGNGILSARANTPGAIEEQQDWPKDYGKPPGGFKPGDKTIFCSGTSMAAPAVSGYAALLREALKQWQDIDTPSAPLMKALLINGTDTLNLPSTVQGYGEINMRKVLTPVRPTAADIKSGKAASGHAEGTASKNQMGVQTLTATVPGPSAVGKKINLQVTLVYHDYHGDKIQNRMNLFVQTQKGKTETAPTTPYDNVHRISMSDMKQGEIITIGVEPILVFKETAPWGVVWEHFEV
jgi:serine protease AprX